MAKKLIEDEFDTTNQLDQSESELLDAPSDENAEEEQFQTRDTYFLRGLLSGVLLCVLLSAIVFSVWFFWSNGGRKSGNGVALNYNKVSNKLELLEQYVNYVYLEDADPAKLEAGIYNGYINALGDKYSAYYTPEEYKELMESTDGQYYGIGVYVHLNKETGTITFKEPFPNGPAEKAGIHKNDVLISIDGTKVTGKSLSDVVSLLKGEKDKVVKVGVQRGDSKEVLTLDVTLGEVEKPTVSHEMLAEKIGYIQVTNFDKVTPTQFEKAIEDLLAKGMKGVVIDLRGNPGGLLTSVVEMLDRIVKEGTLVSTKDKNGKGDTYSATSKQSLELPMSVLINGGSASASELFAGAIQDYGIGTLVGTTSYGKGIVQNIYGLKDGSAVKLTVSKYYTPKGRNIQGTGIEPDVKVELDKALKDKEEVSHEEDNQLQSAIMIVKNKLN